MLVAHFDGKRIEAYAAERGPTHICPECKGVVILKRGRIKIAHFAHKPPTNCLWARGETLAHQEAKKLFRDEWASRGCDAEFEVVIRSLPTDRRADVLIRAPRHRPVAIELQHTTISIEEIEQRASSYVSEGIAQIWIPFIKKSAILSGESYSSVGVIIRRYSARPFEKWAHGFHFKKLWFYEPEDKVLWSGEFRDHELWVEESSWFEEGGNEVYAGGYSRTLKRWKELWLVGPYKLGDVKIKIESRKKAWCRGIYYYPPGPIAQLQAT